MQQKKRYYRYLDKFKFTTNLYYRLLYKHKKKFPRSLKGRQQFNDRLNDIYIDLNAAKEALL